ncbi:MAG: exodeoxyribonuclease V subunit gamma, partial [Alcanivoracaceae bacterium]|nr:exodeoxyribonuclease V subunit gamma [Alcanivoracaceae bacterium]
MIKLYTNDSYKKLYVNLLKLLIDDNSVFTETWLVVPNHSAKQWLQKSLARDLGICTQIKFIMPLSFNWEILKNVAESNSSINVFSNDVIRWQIYQLINDSEEFGALRKESALENFNLSEKIAQTLLKYNDERPELINDWDNGLFQLKKDQEWQADMWIILLTILKEKSPIQLLQKFNPATDFKQKPNKIILFATEQLTTIQKDTILKLADYQDIHLLLTNPSPNEYWFDIKPSATIARDKLFNTELAYLDNIGNSLLANLAYNKMAIFDAFLNHDIDLSMSFQQQKQQSSLLGSIKQDIFELSENPKHCPVDNSIKIHSCHNCLREVEIIKDEILDVLNNNHDLNPEDIIVVSPDINDYVYAIKEVFNDADEVATSSIPFHIDRVQLADNNYITS